MSAPPPVPRPLSTSLSHPRLDLSLLRPLLDAGVFLVALHTGCAYGLAHILSFVIAWALAALIDALAGGGLGRPPGRARVPAQVAVNLMALLLRGGVLALLIGRLDLSAPVAILAAVLTSTLILRSSAELGAPTQSGSDDDTEWRAIAIALGIYALLLRLAYMASVDLFPEEAYYWNYAQHLDFGYLDHPPMVAWLIRAGTAVCGNSAFGVRIGALLGAAVASLFVYRSARDLYGRPSALVALVLMQVLPAYFLAGLFMTPDTPLIAAWAAALYFLQRALLGGHERAWWGAGIALGIGLVCKYTIALLVPATLVFVLSDGPSRRWLLRLLPYAAGVLALVIFSPVILWNARHDWASFAFQTSQRLAEAPHFSLHKLILSAVALLTPVGAAALPYLLRPGPPNEAAAASDPQARRLRFLRAYTLVPLSVFVLFSLRHPVKLDWTGAVWLALVPALAHAIAARGAAPWPQWLRRCWGGTAVVMLLLYGATLHYLTLGPPGVPYSRQLQVLPVAWGDLGAQVDRIAGQMRATEAAEPLVVGMNRYMLASELAFYAHDPARAAQHTASQHLFGPSGLMYEQWFPARLQEGRTLLLVALDARELDDARLLGHADSLGPLRSGVVRRNGQVIGAYYYRAATGYRSVPHS
jgi:dolichol-phosphate mannosyltransferase